MKTGICVAAAVLSLLPALGFSQDEAAIRDTITAFQNCLKADDYEKASAFLSDAFIRQIKAPGAGEQAAAGETADFLHQNAVAFIKSEMDGYYEQCEITAVYQEGDSATAELKPPDGKLVQLELAKDASGAWKITAAKKDVFRQDQKQDESQIQTIRQKEIAREQEQRRDQDIADDVNDDRRR